jgi:hypothetical protein
MLRLRRLLPAAARHAAAYAALGHAAFAEWRHGFARQAVLLVASALLATSALLVGCGWLLYSVRELPARHVIAAAVVLVLAIGAVVSARSARRAGLPGPDQQRLRRELQQDRGLLDELSLRS